MTVCGAGQGATRAGRGPRRGGWACERASVVKPGSSTSIATLCVTSAAPSCRRDGDQTSVRNVRRRCMSSVGRAAKAGAWGAGAPGARASPARPFSVVARSRTCEHGNQCEAQGLFRCVCQWSRYTVRDSAARPPSVCAERALGQADVLLRRHGTWRAARTSVPFGDHAAAKHCPYIQKKVR